MEIEIEDGVWVGDHYWGFVPGALVELSGTVYVITAQDGNKLTLKVAS